MFVFFGGLFFLLFGRLLSIQITGQAEGRPMAVMAEAKYAREAILQAERGKIIDRNGELIASDTLSYRLIAVLNEKATEKGAQEPRHVVDFEKAADLLSRFIPMEKSKMIEIRDKAVANNSNVYQIEFGKAGRDISHETMLAIKEAADKEGVTGLQFIEDKKRFYPNGNFASYLIGFAMREEDENKKVSTVGKMGLEQTYNEALTGVNGKVDFKTDRWGFILPKSEKQIVAAQDGMTIQLTIDKTIQNFVEDAMNQVDEEYSPEKMLVIITNPNTGEIYAMSQRPSFHPSTRVGLTENWLNDAVQNTIEPGSTMKIFTLAAAIEERKWDPFAEFQSGQYTIYDKTIRDVNRTGWGRISFLEGFQRSSNVSMAYLLERMGDRTFIEYLKDFGFGEKVGIDLPNEASGIILDINPSERLTTSYGQGSTVTPIQMIQAATAVANDGKMMKPYVIDKIINPNTEETVEDHKPEEKESPISAETAKQVREILATTVTSAPGTAKKFALSGYSVGGKTGTAEIPKKDGPGYLSGDGNYLYSFLGMAPIEDPQLLAYVIVQQPKLEIGQYGSDPVAKLFTSIMESSLKYMNIVPENNESSSTVPISEFIGSDSSSAIEELREQGFSPVLIGEGGNVISQYPQKGTKMNKGSIVLLETNGDTTLPNFYGWSKKMALSFKMLSGLDIRLNGDGYVTEQSLSEGAVISKDDPVVLQLLTPADLHTPAPQDEEKEEEIIGG
ncbi:penicillin-binding protein [Sporosarcina thermotolerans]|uniref:Penicillin-binding protein n=1 Tax=Sporosarcina thermotolerans TaxID=633404 RepID=A0AAW9A836_9BACL|nr:penicillin-binding protein [Sporosarcina thermotolerans]MDW0115821.1 penicillin-binding protein [Sporosarcina thermotolerans]